MQDSDTGNRLRQVMASVFKCAPDGISEDARLHKFPRWDSLAHIQLVLALETEFGIRVRDADMVRLISFEKWLTYLLKATPTIPSVGR